MTYNLYYLDEDPSKNASSYCDKHVVSCIVPLARLLSCSHHIKNVPWKKGLYNYITIHDSYYYRIDDKSSFTYHLELLISLLSEYKKRYNKIHRTNRLIPLLSKKVSWNTDSGKYIVRPRRNSLYHVDEPVKSHRRHYAMYVIPYEKYTNADVPSWASDDYYGIRTTRTY